MKIDLFAGRLLVVSLLALMPVSAQENHQPAGDGERLKKPSDSNSVGQTMENGMTEVALSKLAQEKGSSTEIQTLGSQLVMNHSQVNDDLKAIAEEQGIAIPSRLDAIDQATVDHFQHLSGKAFDQAYLNLMVSSHETDVKALHEMTHAQDSDMRSFAWDTLRSTQTHLRDIKVVASQVQ